MLNLQQRNNRDKSFISIAHRVRLNENLAKNLISRDSLSRAVNSESSAIFDYADKASSWKPVGSSVVRNSLSEEGKTLLKKQLEEASGTTSGTIVVSSASSVTDGDLSPERTIGMKVSCILSMLVEQAVDEGTSLDLGLTTVKVKNGDSPERLKASFKLKGRKHEFDGTYKEFLKKMVRFAEFKSIAEGC